MDNIEVVRTGALNYHLKFLGDLIEKDPSGMYHLTEKGKLAYRMLTEFPDQERPRDMRLFKAWFVLIVANIVITIFMGYFLRIPIERQAIILTILLLSSGFVYYIRIRPSKSGNRAFFIAVGVVGIGSVLWFTVTSILLFSGLRWQIVSLIGNIGDDFVAFTTL